MTKRFWWVKWVVALIVFLIFGGLVVKEWQKSQILGKSKYRFNLAMIIPEKGVTFVSIDPTEKSILALPFPTSLAINSRTSGEYSISSLYKLGSYKNEGGKFARQKIQGFMRVPVPGYIVVKSEKGEGKSILRRSLLKTIFGRPETSLSRFDAIVLYYRVNRYRWREIGQDELVRAGVVEKNIYHPERLQEYVGTRLFDWGIGESLITVAIVNESGENGLGSDMADFLSNLGLDVVMVRSTPGESSLATSQWQVSDDKSARELSYIFENLFEFDKPKVETVADEYRSKVLIRVGKDAKELF